MKLGSVEESWMPQPTLGLFILLILDFLPENCTLGIVAAACHDFAIIILTEGRNLRLFYDKTVKGLVLKRFQRLRNAPQQDMKNVLLHAKLSQRKDEHRH
jgi:hypothetical protein